MYILAAIIVIAALVHLSKTLFKRDLYGKEVPVLLRYLGAWRVNGGNSGQSIDFRVGKVEGYWAPRLGLRFEISPSYEENYFNIHTCFFWGVLSITLPVRPKSWDPAMGVNDTNEHTYGINKNEDFFSVQWGKHRKVFRIPFLYSIHLKTVELEERHTITFSDYDGEKIECTYWESVMTYRRMWSPFKYTKRRYNYDYHGKEVGDRKGSWKGGTLSGSGFLPKKADIHVTMREHIVKNKGTVQCEQS